VRLLQGRGDAHERMSVLLRLRGLPDAPRSAVRRLLRVLLVCGPHLPAEASRRLVPWYVQARGAKAGSLLLVGNARMKAARDVPAEGATERGPLADALRWTPAAPTGRVVEAFDQKHQRHGRSLKPRASRRVSSNRPPDLKATTSGGSVAGRRRGHVAAPQGRGAILQPYWTFRQQSQCGRRGSSPATHECRSPLPAARARRSGRAG
jgi:hypothetical protein